MKKLFTLALIVLALFAAQTSAFYDRTLSLEFNKDLSLKESITITADQNSFTEWTSDCTKQLKNFVDAKIMLYNGRITELNSQKDLNQETIEQMKADLYKAMNALLSLKQSISCRISRNEESVVLSYTQIKTKPIIDALNAAKAIDEPGLQNQMIIKDIGNSTIEAIFYVNEDEWIPGTQTSLLQLKFKGELKTITPKEYNQKDSALEFKGLQLQEPFIFSFDYLVKPQPKEGKEEAGIIDQITQQIDSFFKEKSSNLLYYGAIGLLGLVALIIAVKVIKGIRRKIKERREEKALPEKDKLKKKILETPAKPEKAKPSTKTSGYMVEMEDIEIKREGRAEKIMEAEEKKVAEPEGKEEQTIEKLYTALKEHKSEFSYDEVKEAIILQGYPESTAEKIAKKIFPEGKKEKEEETEEKEEE